MRPAVTVLILLASLLSGCNIAGPVYYAIAGPEKAGVLCPLDEKRPTLVFVDDPAGVLPSRGLRDDIARVVENDLLTRKVVANMIDTRAGLQAASRDKIGQPLTVTEIGRAVGAEVVLYASIKEFTLSADGQAYKPAAIFAIKVIDAQNDVRLFPTDKEGARIVVGMGDRPGSAPTNRSEAMIAAKELAQRVGLAFAQAFYQHEVNSNAGTYTP